MRQSTQFLSQRLYVVVLSDAIGEVSIRVSQDSFPPDSGIFYAYILFVASITIVHFIRCDKHCTKKKMDCFLIEEFGVSKYALWQGNARP